MDEADDERPRTLDALVRLLRAELADNGLHELDAKRLAKVRHLLDAYKSNDDDWKKYALFDPAKYTRNLVDDGNGKFNLMVLAWGEGHMSAIHDHAGSHCLVKVLDGEVLETKYDWPQTQPDGAGCAPLQVLSEEKHGRDAVTYMHDKIGLHRVENPSHTKGAVTLHLYTPPYSECHTFNESSGQQRASGKMTFYTVRGEKVTHARS